MLVAASAERRMPHHNILGTSVLPTSYFMTALDTKIEFTEKRSTAMARL
jgi:hypothetical protein